MAMGFPDTCKVPAPPGPPVPTPFPNVASCAQAQGTAANVKFAGALVLTVGSKIPSTSGDQLGVGGGVVSGTTMGPCEFKEGSPTVEVEGNDVVTLLKTTAHNGTNANAPNGKVITPSQTVVFIG
jgi:hypothetical protein